MITSSDSQRHIAKNGLLWTHMKEIVIVDTFKIYQSIIMIMNTSYNRAYMYNIAFVNELYIHTYISAVTSTKC